MEEGALPDTHRLQLQGQLRHQTAFPLPWRGLLLGARILECNTRHKARGAVALAALRADTAPNDKGGWVSPGAKRRKADRPHKPMRGKPSGPDGSRPASEG